MKITRTFPDAWITIVAEHANEVVVDFKMYVVVSRNTDGTEPLYRQKDSDTGGDWTPNLDEAEVYCSGHVKWDGCSNLIFDGQNDCMLHFCGNPGRELAARFDALYALAAEMMPGNDEYLLEDRWSS